MGAVAALALRLASLLWAALARALALPAPAAALGAATLFAGAALTLLEAADCEAPERAALALAAVLAAARVLAAEPVLVPALLAVVLVAVAREALVLAAVLLAAVLPAADFAPLAEAGAFGAAAAVAAALFDDAEVLAALAAAVLLVLPAALALAGFWVEGSAATAEVRAVLLPAPRRAPATDALRFFAVFLLEEDIRGYSFCCPAVETGRKLRDRMGSTRPGQDSANDRACFGWRKSDASTI
ncbi:hypothetical protein [Methylosinus sporium]|uniref:hypothetical protein n=1 Tax=Methylosinus sporium TaxID=428 RepID=UPI00383B5132